MRKKKAFKILIVLILAAVFSLGFASLSYSQDTISLGIRGMVDINIFTIVPEFGTVAGGAAGDIGLLVYTPLNEKMLIGGEISFTGNILSLHFGMIMNFTPEPLLLGLHLTGGLDIATGGGGVGIGVQALFRLGYSIPLDGVKIEVGGDTGVRLSFIFTNVGTFVTFAIPIRAFVCFRF